ncbi:uncharacterized protein DS421_19g648710 [Arachis hypogaea]|uniref:Uncharacterized protein n=1 Tax=Arachis hypogaea TaxID=3818 RepID=A0A6B9V5V4_ARAHY|nr:uncharacterized protein DS421_19g648710 [Arachis hypogaea]
MRGRLVGPPETNPVFWTRDYQLVLRFIFFRSTNSIVSTQVGDKFSINRGLLP